MTATLTTKNGQPFTQQGTQRLTRVHTDAQIHWYKLKQQGKSMPHFLDQYKLE